MAVFTPRHGAGRHGSQGVIPGAIRYGWDSRILELLVAGLMGCLLDGVRGSWGSVW